MATLIEGIAFSPISNETDLLSITEGNVQEEIIITNRRKIFEIYQLSDRKPVKSWSVRHGVTLTSPVIGWPDAGKDRFITVTNNQDVRIWDRETVDFERSKKKHSNTRIHQVFVLPDLSPVILYENGAVGFLSNIKEEPSNKCLEAEEAIHWCMAHVKGRKLHVLFVAETKSGLQMFVNSYDKDSETWHLKSSEISKPNPDVTMCSCSSHRTADTVSLYFLWSNQSITKVTVEDGHMIPSSHIQTVPGASKDSSLVMLDGTHAVVTGLKFRGQTGLCIFNVKFGIQQAWQSFTEKPRSKHKAFCVQNYVLVPCGMTLYAYKFDCQASTVVSLLGQGVGTEVSSGDKQTGHFKWSAHGQGQHSIPESATSVMELFEKANNKSLSYLEFQKVFRALMDLVHMPKLKHWSSGNQMSQLIHTMLGQSKYWPQAEIEKLISMGSIPHSLIGELFDSLIQHSEVGLVCQVIDSVPNIPEKCLCKALSFYLSCEEGKLQSAVNGIENMEVDEKEDGTMAEPSRCPCPLSAHRAFLINKILQLPYSDVFLLESLRHISFKHALTLLEYLSYLLQTQTVSVEKKDKAKAKDPLMLQVVDWLALVMDAHMTQFVLSPDSHVTLVNLRALVASQVEFYGSLVSLEALLEQLKAKTSLRKEEKVGKYCIEVLHVL